MGLEGFLDRAASTPVAPGTFDCCLWLADWGLELTGLDGAEEWRGTYSDPLGCLGVMRAHGGVARLVRRGAVRIGMERRATARRGDVGVLRALDVAGRPVHVGGVFTGRRWAFLVPGGLGFTTAAAVAAWGL